MASSAALISAATLLLLILQSSESAQRYSFDTPESRMYKFYDTSSAVLSSDRNLLGTSRRYVSTMSEFPKVSRRNVREKDIAAIFRGVAYGITESPGLSKSSEIPTSTTSVPASSTTAAPEPIFRTSTRLELIRQHQNENSEQQPPEAGPQSNENNYDDQPRNGILNYYVEREINTLSGSHSGHREYYPTVISSIPPETEGRSQTPGKYIVAETKIGQTMHVHVYMIGILMGLIVLISLVSLCRIHSCTQLIPRGHYVTLQLLILLVASLRCIILLHDPYGLQGKLPRALISLLMHTVPPILSTAFALMLLILLRAAKFSLLSSKVQSPLVLAVLTGMHIGTSVLIDVSNGVLHYPESARKLVTGIQCFTIVWNIILIIGHVCLLYQTFIRISKRRIILPQYTCAVMCVAVMLQGILLGFSFYHICNREFRMNPEDGLKTWSWWVLVSFERLIEGFFCASLLAAAATLTMKQSNSNTNEQKIFSVGTSYDAPSKSNTLRGRSPLTGKNFMASNYALASTMQKKGNTVNGNFVQNFKAANENTYESAGDFAVRWNMPKPDICAQEPNCVNECYSPNLPEQERRLPDQSTIGQPMQVNSSSLSSRTLPAPRYYCAPVPVIEKEVPVVSRVATYTLRPQKTPNIYCEIEDPTYDVAPYYTKSIPSTSSEIYSSPHLLGSNYMQDAIPDHLYELPEVHRPTNMNHNSASYADFSNRQLRTNMDDSSTSSHHLLNQISGNLMLPLQNSQSRFPSSSHSQRNSTLDTSPDSAIVLDYSSHSEIEDQNGHMLRHHAQKSIYEQQASVNNRLDFMKMSTHSLNEVFKHNSGLLSKLVGSSNTSSGYQPLNVDDSHLFNTDPTGDLNERDDGETSISVPVEFHKSRETEVTSPRKVTGKSSVETADVPLPKVPGGLNSSEEAVAISSSSPVTSL